jgi:hypothetical protein
MKTCLSLLFLAIAIMLVFTACEASGTVNAGLAGSPQASSSPAHNNIPTLHTNSASSTSTPVAILTSTVASTLPATSVNLSTTKNTVGLILNSPGASAGYTLIAPKHYTSTYLINNQGQLVHTWTGSQYEPGQSAYLLENGHLIRAAMTRGPLSTGGGEGGRIEEYDWNSQLVWQLDFSTDKYMQHHDFVPLPNGNILLLAVDKKTYDEAIAAGFDPGKLDSEINRLGYMLPDAVYEIKPSRPVGGTIVWEWHVWDHLVQDFSASRNNYGSVGLHPELIDPNGGGQKIPSFWNHMNSITYNPTLDQVMLSVRGNSEIWIIDHSTNKSEATSHSGGKYGRGGDLLYRWGNPAQYRAGTPKEAKLFQQHNATWIPQGYPGAGDIMVFNNGLGRQYSTVDQWTPPVGTDGKYILTPGKAYGPSDFSWTYRASPPSSLYDEAISGAQRLPNGNTLIDSGTHGRFIEVNAAKETVWEYINPVVKSGPLGRTDAIPADSARQGEFMNACFRVLRYGLDYPAFINRILTPVGTIEH